MIRFDDTNNYASTSCPEPRSFQTDAFEKLRQGLRGSSVSDGQGTNRVGEVPWRRLCDLDDGRCYEDGAEKRLLLTILARIDFAGLPPC